jgi:hypothetical protein
MNARAASLSLEVNREALHQDPEFLGESFGANESLHRLVDTMVKVLVAVLFLFTVSPSPALTVTNASGVAHERDSVKGKIVRIDQNSITVHWFPGSSGKMGTHQLSHVDTFQLTPQTVYENCTWTSISKGATVRLYGHGNIVDRVKLAGRP